MIRQDDEASLARFDRSTDQIRSFAGAKLRASPEIPPQDGQIPPFQHYSRNRPTPVRTQCCLKDGLV